MNKMFSEIERLDEQLTELSETITIEKAKKGIAKMREIAHDVLKNKENSQYFEWVCPFDAYQSMISQGRRITFDPAHLKDVKDSIIKAGQVNKALLLTVISAAKLYEVLNGNHRHKNCVYLKENNDDFADMTYPAVIIPASEYGIVHPVLWAIQGILNDHEPAKPANENDIQKTMAEMVEKLGYDLKKEEHYDEVVNTVAKVFKHKPAKTIKWHATRLRGIIASQGSDVTCGPPSDFVEGFLSAFDGIATDIKTDFCSFELAGKKYVRAKVDFVALGKNSGSRLDQAFIREAIFKYDYPSRTLVQVFASVDNSGDSQTTLINRKTFFQKQFKAYKIFGKKGVVADFVAIAPQNKSSFQTRLGGKKIETLPEKIELASHWIIVTKQEMIDQFKKGIPYKEEWIAREKQKQTHLKLVSS